MLPVLEDVINAILEKLTLSTDLKTLKLFSLIELSVQFNVTELALIELVTNWFGGSINVCGGIKR